MNALRERRRRTIRRPRPAYAPASDANRVERRETVKPDRSVCRRIGARRVYENAIVGGEGQRQLHRPFLIENVISTSKWAKFLRVYMTL